MPANIGRHSGTRRAAAPYAPSTWNHAPNSSATSARPARPSTTPALVDPAAATTRPTSLRSCIDSRSAAPVNRPSSPVGTTSTSDRPSKRNELPTEACAVSATATQRRSPIWSRATASADRLPMDPPLMKQPPADAGRPIRSAIHRSVWFSAATAPPASSQLSALNVAAPTAASIHTPAADGATGMNARYRSLSRPTLLGATRSTNRAHAASAPSPDAVIVPSSKAAIAAGDTVRPSGACAIRSSTNCEMRAARSAGMAPGPWRLTRG